MQRKQWVDSVATGYEPAVHMSRPVHINYGGVWIRREYELACEYEPTRKYELVSEYESTRKYEPDYLQPAFIKQLLSRLVQTP